MSKPLVLAVDDEAAVLALVKRVAQGEGFDVLTCEKAAGALELAAERQPDLVLVDLRMPDVGGLEIVRQLKHADSKAMIVLMTGHGSIDSAVEAVREGAADYLTKPFDLERLKGVFGIVREEAERRAQVMAAESALADQLQFSGMVGRSNVMQEVFSLIRRLAPHIRTALVTGETGSGKELVARALHLKGPRAKRRFVAVNCSAIPETLFESELFGHVRGAFTGASEAKAGLFEVADGGTLFLDEIGELPLALQAKLLRVLETGEVQRVGSVQTTRCDVRVVCATNRDLARESAAGRFRSDLLYRLNVAELHVPSLCERREDIPLLAARFINEFRKAFGKNITGITAAAERQLQAARWPGNVRELRNVIERACMLSAGGLLTERDLSIAPPAEFDAAAHRPELPQVSASLRGRLSSIEREALVLALNETQGNKAEAARRLGLSRRALYRVLKRHGLRSSAPKRSSEARA